MATISDLWEGFTRFQKSALVLDASAYYSIVLWEDGEGELLNDEWVQVTHWETFDEGIEKLNELTARNKAAQS